MAIISFFGFYAFVYLEDKAAAANRVGYAASLASIVMFGSPLAQIVTKSDSFIMN
jgi:hypothetical protein